MQDNEHSIFFMFMSGALAGMITLISMQFMVEEVARQMVAAAHAASSSLRALSIEAQNILDTSVPGLPSVTMLGGKNCSQIKSGSAIPSGYGSPLAFFSGNQLAIDLFCAAESSSRGRVNISVGTGSSNEYIYKTGYIYKDNTWSPITFTGDSTASDWVIGTAESSQTLATSELGSSETGYVLAYICTNVDNSWKCGCRDQACTQNLWQIQTFSRAAITEDSKVTQPTTNSGSSGTSANSSLYGELYDRYRSQITSSKSSITENKTNSTSEDKKEIDPACFEKKYVTYRYDRFYSGEVENTAQVPSSCDKPRNDVCYAPAFLGALKDTYDINEIDFYKLRSSWACSKWRLYGAELTFRRINGRAKSPYGDATYIRESYPASSNTYSGSEGNGEGNDDGGKSGGDSDKDGGGDNNGGSESGRGGTDFGDRESSPGGMGGN